MRSRWLGLVVVAITLGFSLWAYPRLPGEVNLRGGAGDGTSRWFITTLIPVMIVVIWGIHALLPRIDPKGGNYAKFIETYWRIGNGSFLVLGALHVVVLGIGVGWDLDLNRAVMVSAGILLLIYGNYMRRVQPTWFFIGIRTPWTLSSETVWRRTQRTASWLLVLVGVVTLVGSLVALRLASALVMPALLVVALVLVVQSYVLWRKEQQG
jgi:uncharacterized membrane protein